MENTPDKPREAQEKGVDPEVLLRKCTDLLKGLGYDKRLPTERVVDPQKPTDRPRSPASVAQNPDVNVMDVAKERNGLRSSVAKQQLSFADVVRYRRLEFLTTTSILREDRRRAEAVGAKKDAVPEFDENLLRALNDFDEDRIFDFIVTVQRYAELAKTVPDTARDAKMRFWEARAMEQLELLEKTSEAYAKLLNVRVLNGLEPRDRPKEELQKRTGDVLEFLKNFVATKDGNRFVIKLQVSEEAKDGKEQVAEKTVVIDEDLFKVEDESKDPKAVDRNNKRKEQLDWVEDALRQTMRQAVGKGVPYDLSVPVGSDAKANDRMEAKGIREMLAKNLARVIVGRRPRVELINRGPTEVSMPHAMYGKLLMGQIESIRGEGLPEFDPNKKERIPNDLEKLKGFRESLLKLSEFHEENVHYTLSQQLRSTVELMAAGEGKSFINFPEEFSVSGQAGSLVQRALPAKGREGITVDQPGDNLAAMETFLTTSDKVFSQQFADCEQVEKNIDRFMSNDFAKAMEWLNSIKAKVITALQYVPPNYVLSRAFPGLRIDENRTRLIEELQREFDSIKKKNEEYKKSMGEQKKALGDAIQAMRAEMGKLKTLQQDRLKLVTELNVPNLDPKRRQEILDLLRKNEEGVRAVAEASHAACLKVCEAHSLAIKTCLSLFYETQVADNYYTARDANSMWALLVSVGVFLDWASGHQGTRFLGRVAGRLGEGLGNSLVPGARLGTAFRAPLNRVATASWQVGRRAMLSPIPLIQDLQALRTRFFGGSEAEALRAMNGTEAVARQAEVMSKAARVNMAEGALKLFGGGFDAAKLGAAERQALQNAIWNAHQVPKTGPGGTWALGDLRAKIRILTTEGKLTQAQARMLIEAGYCGPCSANTIAANLRAAGFPQIAEETTTIARMFSTAEAAKNTAPAATNTVRSSARALEVSGEQGARVAKSLSPEAKTGLQALENTGKGLRWGRVVPVAVVALDAFIVYDSYNNLNNAKEYVQKLQDELKDMLPKAGFNKVEEGVYEREGVTVRVTDLTKLTEQQVAIARQRLQSNVAVGVAGLAILCADTGIGIPLGLALAAGAATIEINHSVNERSKMVSFIENADPWILAYMGTSPLTKVPEQDFLVTQLFKWGVTDLFINKSPEFQRKVAFSMFMSHLKGNPSMLAEIVGTDFSPKSINEFYNTDFKNLVYPSMTAFLFTGMKDSTAPWTDIREFRLQAGSLNRRYADESDVKSAMGDATLFYIQHLREKRYMFYRRSLEQSFLESQRLATSSNPEDQRKAVVLMEQAQALDLIVKSLGGQIVFGKMLSEVDAVLETSEDSTRAERYLVKLRSKIEGSLQNGVRAESFYEYVDQPHTHVPGTRGEKQIDRPLFGGEARATRPVYPKIAYRVSGRDLGNSDSRALPELVIGDRQNLWDMAYGGSESIRKLEGGRTGNLQRFVEKFPMNVRSVFVRECNTLSEKELETLDVNLIQGMYHDDAENLQKFLCTVGPSAIKGFIVLFANLSRQNSFSAVRSINALSNEQCARFFAYVQEYLPYKSEDRLRHVLTCLETATVDNFRSSRQDDVFATRSVLSVLQARKAAEDFRQKMEEGYEKDRAELLAMTQLDNWRGLKPLGDSRNKEGPFLEMRVVDRMADAKNPIFEFAYAGDVIDQSFLGTNAQIPRDVAVSPATLSNGINPPLQKNFVVTQFDGQTGKKIGTFSIDWKFRSSKTLTDAEKLMRMRVLTSPTGSEARMEPLQRILDLFPHQVTHQQRVVEGKTYNDFSKPSTLYFVELQKKLESLYRSSENRREFLEDLFLQLEAAGGITEQSVKNIPEFLEKKQQKQREEKLQKRLEDCMQIFNGYESAEDATNAVLRIEEKDGKKFWVIDYTPSDAAMGPFMEKGLRKCFDGQYLPRLVSIDVSDQRNIRLRLEDIPPASGKEYWPSGQFQDLKRNFKKFEQGEFAERVPGKNLELMLHRGILSILNDEGAGIKLDPSKASSADIAKAIAELRLPWLSTENDQLVVDGKVVVRGWTSLLQQKPNEALDMLANVYVPIGKEKPSEQVRTFETMQWRLRNLFSMSGLYLHPNIGEGSELNYRLNQERPERVVPDIQNELNGFGLNGSVRVPPSSKVEVGGKELLVGRSLEVGNIQYSRSKDYIMISARQGGAISLTVDGKEYTKR